MQDERLCDGAACGVSGCQIPYGYCHCGCGAKTTVQPKKFVLNHDKRAVGARYEVDPKTGCWLWLDYINHKGYGQMRDGDGMRFAHIVFYERAKGPVPEGLQLDHLCHTNDKNCLGGSTCRHRRCVNPDHLRPVTAQQNSWAGRKAKLTIEDIREIREAPNVYGSTTDLARKFNVHPSTISKIRNRRGGAWALK